MIGTRPTISVVIPTRDRATLLEKALGSLSEQTLQSSRFEVIVVDDGSTDDTQGVCGAFNNRLFLQYHKLSTSGIAAAKNLGLFASSGELVYFFDDDDIAHPDLLEKHVAYHRAYPSDRIAVLGYTTWHPELEITPLMMYLTEVGQHLFSYPSLEPDQLLGFGHFWGGRSSAKRGFLAEHGVFNQDFTFGYEDVELEFRLSTHGLRVVYCPDAISYMIRPVTLEQYCARCERQGRSLARLAALHQEPKVQEYCRIQISDATALPARELGALITKTQALEDRLSGADADHDGQALRSLYGAYEATLRAHAAAGVAKGPSNA